MDFKLQMEKMVSKQRMNENNSKKENINKNKAHTSVKDKKQGSKNENRLEFLNKEWLKIRDSLVYDPILNRINFNKRRVSEYKHNKKVTLPSPMTTDKEV